MAWQMPAFDDDVWELYDSREDCSQARNLAAEQPEMLAKLQRLWLIEATKYNVLPLDDRSVGAVRCRTGRTPYADPGELAAVLRRDGPPVGEQRRQHQEQVVFRHGRGRRARGGRRRRHRRPGRPLRRMGGLLQGRQGQVRLQRPRHAGVHRRGGAPLPAAPTRCAWSSPTTAADWRRVATCASSRWQPRSGKVRAEATQPIIFSADETTDIGYESGTPVTSDYPAQEQPLHRQDPLGPARCRHRRPRPLHRPRGAPADRDGPPMTTVIPRSGHLAHSVSRALGALVVLGASAIMITAILPCAVARPRAGTSTTATARRACSASSRRDSRCSSGSSSSWRSRSTTDRGRARRPRPWRSSSSSRPRS